jgi:hypothetical protein
MEPLSFNPYKEFIGRTIADIKYYSGWIDIFFTDGTSGYIDMSLPEGTPRNKAFLGGTFGRTVNQYE